METILKKTKFPQKFACRIQSSGNAFILPLAVESVITRIPTFQDLHARAQRNNSQQPGCSQMLPSLPSHLGISPCCDQVTRSSRFSSILSIMSRQRPTAGRRLLSSRIATLVNEPFYLKGTAAARDYRSPRESWNSTRPSKSLLVELQRGKGKGYTKQRRGGKSRKKRKKTQQHRKGNYRGSITSQGTRVERESSSTACKQTPRIHRSLTTYTCFFPSIFFRVSFRDVSFDRRYLTETSVVP